MVVLFVASLLLASCGENARSSQTGQRPGSDVLNPPQPNLAQNLAGLHIVPTASNLGVAEASSVEVRLENAVNLYGLHLSLQFDPRVLRVQDNDAAQDGVQIAPGVLPVPDFTVVNVADNEQGKIEYAVTQLNPRQPAQGDGVVAIIHFQTVGAGVSPLVFSYTKLAGPDGREIPVQVDDVTLKVSWSNSSQKTAGSIVQTSG